MSSEFQQDCRERSRTSDNEVYSHNPEEPRKGTPSSGNLNDEQSIDESIQQHGSTNGGDDAWTRGASRTDLECIANGVDNAPCKWCISNDSLWPKPETVCLERRV
jgi:hypothetical protein